MYKCRHCNVIIYDDMEVCPLCHSVLDEMEPEERVGLENFSENGAPYPDVR